MTNAQCLKADRIQRELEAIPLGHTTARYGLVITRWAGGLELGSVTGRNLRPASDVADEIAMR